MANNTFGLTIKPVPHDKDMLLRGVRETHLVIPAEKEFKLINAKTGNLPLSFSVEQYYGEPWTPGGNDLMYAQKVRWLDNYEREGFRNRALYQANQGAASYQKRYGSAVSPEQTYGAFYAPQSVAQMDPVNILMRRWGIKSSGYKNGKREMTAADRKKFMEEVERRYGNDAEAMDYYYFMLYMYLKGCAYFVELNKIAVAQGGSPLSEDDLMHIVYKLYQDRKDNFEIHVNGTSLPMTDRGFTNVIKHDLDTLVNSKGERTYGLDVGNSIYGKGTLYNNMLRAAEKAGVITNNKSDYWARTPLYIYKRDAQGNIVLDEHGNRVKASNEPVHWVLKGQKGEMIETMPERPFNAEKQQQYIDAGINLDWYRKNMGR